ncbi:MAG: J domain-containing protein, partial [Myxococcales bacterium]|nr:J domain-containing protein [Myxococcales bacterium]
MPDLPPAAARGLNPCNFPPVSAVFVDFYELLEVQPQASSQEIKAAYRACMVRDHADQNPDDALASERMILLSR